MPQFLERVPPHCACGAGRSNNSSSCVISVASSLGRLVGSRWSPELTLSQPGRGADYALHITTWPLPRPRIFRPSYGPVGHNIQDSKHWYASSEEAKRWILLFLQAEQALVPLRHSSSKCLKCTKNRFTWSHFTNLSKQVSAESHAFRFRSSYTLYIQNSSNCCWWLEYDP